MDFEEYDAAKKEAEERLKRKKEEEAASVSCFGDV